MLTQYKLEQGQKLILIDTDPTNKTFSRYKSYDVKEFDFVENTKVNREKFDDIVEIILNANGKEVQSVIIDNGASSFLPFSGAGVSCFVSGSSGGEVRSPSFSLSRDSALPEVIMASISPRMMP